MISAKEFAAQGEKYLGTLYSQMDCQAFVEKMLSDVGFGLNLAGSNAWFRYMTTVLTPEDCVRLFGEVPVGAFLFIHAHDGGEPAKYQSDGKGNASHMGVRTGANTKGAIHSSKSRGGVVWSDFYERTINGGWNAVGLVDWMDYGNEKITRFFWGDEEPGTDQNDSGQKESEKRMTATVVSDNGKGVNLRLNTSTDSILLAKIPEGAEVEVLEEMGTWKKIAYGGKTGYAMSRFLQVNASAVADNAGENDSGQSEYFHASDEVTLTLPRSVLEVLHEKTVNALYPDAWG